MSFAIISAENSPLNPEVNESTYQVQIQTQQELSYRKQIARQLRTQYVDGIYRSDYPWPWNLG